MRRKPASWPADVAPAACDIYQPPDMFKVQNAGGKRESPVPSVHPDVKTTSAALVGTASKGMGVRNKCLRMCCCVEVWLSAVREKRWVERLQKIGVIQKNHRFALRLCPWTELNALDNRKGEKNGDSSGPVIGTTLPSRSLSLFLPRISHWRTGETTPQAVLSPRPQGHR